MTILKNKDIRTLGEKELLEKVKELKLEMLKTNAQKATQSTSGTKRIKEIKKTIAKIKTQINTVRK